MRRYEVWLLPARPNYSHSAWDRVRYGDVTLQYGRMGTAPYDEFLRVQLPTIEFTCPALRQRERDALANLETQPAPLPPIDEARRAAMAAIYTPVK